MTVFNSLNGEKIQCFSAESLVDDVIWHHAFVTGRVIHVENVEKNYHVAFAPHVLRSKFVWLSCESLPIKPTMHGNGLAMNARWLSVLAIISTLGVTTGCGTIKNMLFGVGAACHGCAMGNPGPAAPLPPYGPGAMGGCGAPHCAAPYGSGCGCGSEYGSGYMDAMGQGFPADGTIIGSPVIQDGIYGGMPVESYNQGNWTPSPSAAPAQPAGPMAPAPTR